VDNAIEIAGPSYDALIDGVIYSNVSWFVFASRHTFTVVGTPIKTSMLQKGADNASILYHSSLGVSDDGATLAEAKQKAVSVAQREQKLTTFEDSSAKRFYPEDR